MYLQTRDDVVEYVRARLGHPVIDLELELQERDGLGHVHLAIQDSLDFMYRHNQDESNYKDCLVVKLRIGIMEYTLPKDISDVIDVKQSWGGFTPWMAFDVAAGESLVASTMWGGNFDLVTYTAGQRYLSDVKKLVGQSYQVQYHPASNMMRIYPTPKEDRFVIMEVFRKDLLAEVFNMINFRDLVVARTRYIWGTVLMKDEGGSTMPGGSKVNGSAILSLAEKELEKIEKRIIDESSPPMIRFG